MTGKGNFFDPVIHVPLIARPPGGCGRSRAGESTDAL